MAPCGARGPVVLTALLLNVGITFYTVLCVSEVGHEVLVQPHELQIPKDLELPLPPAKEQPALAMVSEQFDVTLGQAKVQAGGTMHGWPENMPSARRRRRTMSVRWSPPESPGPPREAPGTAPPPASTQAGPGMSGQAGTRRRRRSVPLHGLGPATADWGNVSSPLPGAPYPQVAVGSSRKPGSQQSSTHGSAYRMPLPFLLLLQIHMGTQQMHAGYLAILLLGSILVTIAAIAFYSKLEPEPATVQQGAFPEPGKAATQLQKSSAGCTLPVLLSERSAAAAYSGSCGKSPVWRGPASSRSLPPVASSGPSPRLPGPSPRSPSAHLQHLCPDLVVPERMEFVFAVREALNTARQQISFSIVDLKGQPLSHIIVNESGQQCGIHLQMLDGTPLAWVRTESLYERPSRCLAAGRARELEHFSTSLEICRPSGELFCLVSRDEGIPCYRYILRSKAGQRLYTYYGNFCQKAVNVTNASGQLVCTSERCLMDFDTAPHYQVRVAPQTDAGLLLCGLLSIDKLEGGHHTC